MFYDLHERQNVHLNGVDDDGSMDYVELAENYERLYLN